MKLNEYLGKGNLISLLVVSGVDFLQGKDAVTLNSLMLVNYGERELYSKFELLELQEISDMVALIHSQHWQDLIALKASEINPIYSQTNTLTETVTETGNTTNTSEKLNKVSASNSDVLITNDGDSANQNENKQGETVRTLTDHKMNVANAYNNLSLSAKNNIINIVIKDIVDFLTLTIY